MSNCCASVYMHLWLQLRFPVRRAELRMPGALLTFACCRRLKLEKKYAYPKGVYSRTRHQRGAWKRQIIQTSQRWRIGFLSLAELYNGKGKEATVYRRE